MKFQNHLIQWKTSFTGNIKAKHRFCSIRRLGTPGLHIVPVKINTDTQNLLDAMPSLCAFTRNINHSDQILPLLNLPVVPVNIIWSQN